MSFIVKFCGGAVDLLGDCVGFIVWNLDTAVCSLRYPVKRFTNDSNGLRYRILSNNSFCFNPRWLTPTIRRSWNLISNWPLKLYFAPWVCNCCWTQFRITWSGFPKRLKKLASAGALKLTESLWITKTLFQRFEKNGIFRLKGIFVCAWVLSPANNRKKVTLFSRLTHRIWRCCS